MALRAVLFDIDDTLFPTSAFAERARRRAVQAMVDAGLAVDADEAYEELQEVVAEFSSNYGRHFNQLVLRLGSKIRDGVHPAIVVASGVQAYHATKEHLAAFPDALAALDELRRTDLVRGVISNGLTVKQAEKIVRLGLSNAFSANAIFISEEIGVAKPHPRIFTVACDSVGVSPEEAMYVGDNPEMDVGPAHDAGLITCLRRGSGKHANDRGDHKPDFEISDFSELMTILREQFGVVVSDA